MADSKIAVEPHWAAVALIFACVVAKPCVLLGSLTFIATSYIVAYHSTIPAEFRLLKRKALAMDAQAINLAAAIRNNAVPMELKLRYLNELKADIKHRQVPETAIIPAFDVVRVAIATPALLDAGFSILGHLAKRLVLQEQTSILVAQGIQIYPSIVERLGDHKDRVRQRAAQALTDFWSASPVDVEQVIRDSALTSKHPRAKEAGMQWVAKTHKDRGFQFRSFVPNIVDCLEDADGNVRETAKATVIELFQHANDRAKSDLTKQLQQRNVRKTIAVYVLSQLGLPVPSEIQPATSTHSQDSEPRATNEVSGGSVKRNSLPPAATVSVAEQEAEQLDPAYMDTARDLEETFREMQPHFEGKESEQNWSRREKSIIKLRKITKGNAPQEFTTTYLVGIKGLLDGILKTVNSLRTTVSTNGCHLVQDIARVAGPGLDNMVEILLQSLIKVCAHTKKISAANGNITVNAILANVTFHARLVQHIWMACQDKNVQPRNFATQWLKTIINQHSHQKSVLEHAGGLELIEKCIKTGLADRDKKVRDTMRPTYWAFARLWPEKAEGIMSTLDKKQQDLLLQDPSNPNPRRSSITSASVPGPKAPAFSHSTTSIPSAKSSIRDTIAAQKRAKIAGKQLPERPGSADSAITPAKPASFSATARPAHTNTSKAVGTLSSAPVRPMRPARRPELPRPATADPYASRRVAKTETPTPLISPAGSPVKTKPKTPAPATIGRRRVVTEDTTKKAEVEAANNAKLEPEGTATPDQAQSSPTKAAEDFTMVIPSLKATNKPVEQQHSPKKSPQDVATVGTSLEATANPVEFPPSPRQRISMSPQAINGRKENLARSNILYQQSPLKVYEDPIQCTENTPIIQSAIKWTALEELPVNEPANPPRLVSRHTLLAEEGESPHYHKKWIDLEAKERQLSTPEKVDNPIFARRILESGIVRVRARSLDVHGFRKLQILIRSGNDIWDDGTKFDELLLPLLEYLESPNDDSKLTKVQDLKTQVLVTIRLMLQHQPDYFSTFYPRALCAILTARKHLSSTSHLVCGLEETAEYIVGRCEPEDCIDSVLDLLETENTDGDELHTVFMGMYTLAGLLHRGHGPGKQNHLTSDQETRMGKMAARCLADTNPDLRRAVIEYTLELHDSIEKDSHFWKLLGSAREDHRSLITYYIAKRAHVAEALRQMS